MTKAEFLTKLSAIYAVGNRSDNPEAKARHREEWTFQEMAGEALCQPLDTALLAMREAGILTEDDVAFVYDNL